MANPQLPHRSRILNQCRSTGPRPQFGHLSRAALPNTVNTRLSPGHESVRADSIDSSTSGGSTFVRCFAGMDGMLIVAPHETRWAGPRGPAHSYAVSEVGTLAEKALQRACPRHMAQPRKRLL